MSDEVIEVDPPTGSAIAVAAPQHVQTRPDDYDPLISVIANAARDPATDVAKFEALFRLQREVMRDRAVQEFRRSMAAAQSEMHPVVRSAKNDQTNSKYARLETIDAAIRPIYTRHGFSMSFNQVDGTGAGICLECALSHTSQWGGHTELYRLEAAFDSSGIKGSVNKTPMHAMGSSVSYLRRYLTNMIWNIALANEDDDGNRGNRINDRREPEQDQRRDTRPGPAAEITRLGFWSNELRTQKSEEDWIKRLEDLSATIGSMGELGDVKNLPAIKAIADGHRGSPATRSRMAAAWRAAALRLSPQDDLAGPGQAALAEALKAKQQEEFDAATSKAAQETALNGGMYALDEKGNPGLLFHLPLQFANWFAAAMVSSQDPPALITANAQSIEECKADAAATMIIRAACQKVEDADKREAEAVHQDEVANKHFIPMEKLPNGTRNRAKYNIMFGERLGMLTTQNDINEFEAANRETYEKQPNHSQCETMLADRRKLVIQTIDDEKFGADLILQLEQAPTAADLVAVSQVVANKRFMSRIGIEKKELFARIKGAGDRRHAELVKAEGAAS